MFTLMSYYRDPAQLSGPLLELQEVETAVANPYPNSRPRAEYAVVVRELYIVRYGPSLSENEGHALLFIESNLSTPAPRLCAMYRDTGNLYIVTEYIPGKNLENLWDPLSKQAKCSLVSQLRPISHEMRSLPTHGFYGGVEGGPVPHRWFRSTEHITGPFKKEEDFSRAMALRSKDDHQLSFFHGTLTPGRILARKIHNPLSGTEEYKVIAIVDWEAAASYPTYWEYAYGYHNFQWYEDWSEYFEKFLDPWPVETAVLASVDFLD